MKWIVTATLVGAMGTGLYATDSVRFAIGEWQPYTGQNMDGHGMVTEIVTTACNTGGLKADYEFFPWKRAESNVEMGKNFATFPYQAIKEREGRFLYLGRTVRLGDGHPGSRRQPEDRPVRVFQA